MTSVNEEICVLALALIGKRRFSSLDDGSTEANTCKTFYARALKSYLTSFPWSYLITDTDLSPETTDSFLKAYKYAYKPPVDMLRIVEVTDTSDGETDNSTWLDERFTKTDYSADVNTWAAENGIKVPPVNFKEAGGLIHANFKKMQLVYTKFDDTVSKMPTHVFDGFVSALALMIVLPLTKDLKLYKTVEEEHKRRMAVSEDTETFAEYNTAPTGSRFEDVR